MISRTEAEDIIRNLTGGTSPEHLNSIIFDKVAGWVFRAPTSGVTVSTILISGAGWYTPNGATDADADSAAEVYGFRFYLNPGTEYLSVTVLYDPGSGSETYTYNVSSTELHTLFLSDGVTPWVGENDVTTFDITIVPFTAAAGGGTAGTPVIISTGATITSGVGVIGVAHNTTAISGTRIQPGHPFDFEMDATTFELLLRLRAAVDSGNQVTTWAPDYKNGPTQTVTLTGDLIVGDITDFPAGGTMNIHFILGGHELTFSGTYFQGLILVFNTEAYVAVSVVDFGLAKLVIGGMEYT